MDKGLFSDLLVIDCASFIAGPAAATIMADFGARVIKIEPPVTGDSYRQLIHVPGMPPADEDYFWLLDNRNKESLSDHLDCAQVAANGLPPAIEGANGLRTVDSPIRMTGEEKRKPHRAPAIGELTRNILAGFGFGEDEISRMIESGAAAG